MFIIQKQGFEKQELLAHITALHAAKVLGIKTKNVVLEFAEIPDGSWGNAMSPEGQHIIHVNKENGVTKIIETVCHELRHVWQAQNGWVFDFSKPYMEQEHEIDAWDFMYRFTEEFKDKIYSEYLDKRESLDDSGVAIPEDWENYLEAPPEVDYEYLESDLSEMMGLSYKNKRQREKETNQMTTKFTVKQINNAGLVASEGIKEKIAKAGIKNVKGLKALRTELEQDNRGTVRINFKDTETFAYLLADKMIKGEIEGFEVVAKEIENSLVKVLLNFQTEQLKAGKYLLDSTAFVVSLTEEKAKALIKHATVLTHRYEKNLDAIKRYVADQGYEGADADKIVRYISAHHAERMRDANLTNTLFKPVVKLFEEAVAELFPQVSEVVAESIDTAVEAGVPEEEIIKTEEQLEEFMTEETPAADESSVAEETNTEKDDEQMTEVPVVESTESTALVDQFKTVINEMQEGYEAAIAELKATVEAQAKEIAELKATKVGPDVELVKELKEARAELDTVKVELDKANSLRKADAKRIDKLQEEMGRARLKLREHKVREVAEDKVFELPEQATGAVVKSRIVSAQKIGFAGMDIHEKAPEKIAAAAEKTKDGIQWVADVAKSGVDATAKGTNVATELFANSMIYVAEKIAPTEEVVAKSVLKKNGEETVVVVGGKEYSYDKDGKLIIQ